jgi:hypothetical protein
VKFPVPALEFPVSLIKEFASNRLLKRQSEVVDIKTLVDKGPRAKALALIRK